MLSAEGREICGVWGDPVAVQRGLWDCWGGGGDCWDCCEMYRKDCLLSVSGGEGGGGVFYLPVVIPGSGENRDAELGCPGLWDVAGIGTASCSLVHWEQFPTQIVFLFTGWV
jgi:hypothetical protein